MAMPAVCRLMRHGRLQLFATNAIIQKIHYILCNDDLLDSMVQPFEIT